MKEFKPTSWAIDNVTSIYIITIIISIFGMIAYDKLQKEHFPDIVIPTVYVGTAYPGTSPSDMENLVTRPIEQELKSLSGVKKVTSNSVQDFSSIQVEFNTDVEVTEAKQRVKDAVDKARPELPTDLPAEPNVQEINFSEFPIMYINLSGDYSNERLKKYAENLQDRIEAMKEITRVDIVGALDREVKIDVDMHKMQAAKITFADIEAAIARENMTVSGGSVRVGEMKRPVRVVGQYTDPNEIGNIVIQSMAGAPIYLKDIARVEDGFEERESFARLAGKPVITLNVVKRSGENLISASDQIQEILAGMQATSLPKDLKISVTGDRSKETRNTLHELINTIIIGFVLVTLILMFFMGTTNAIFVGLSVPISCFLAFLVMPTIDFSLNMIVLFAFLLALGIVVDDAIVVIENTHRIFHTSKASIKKVAKRAAGEVFVPVLAGTLTTLAPFIPLAFWPGMVGEFMFYLPITLILTLVSSLLVAFFINPVFAVTFMKKETATSKKRNTRSMWITVIIVFIIALTGYASGSAFFGNLMVFFALIILINRYVFSRLITGFQNNVLPRFMNAYERLLSWMLVGKRPYGVLASIFGLLIFSFVLISMRNIKVDFFPDGDPNFIYTYIKMPIGTDQAVTDSVTKVVEGRIYKIIGTDNPDVESVIANVAVGAGDPNEGGMNVESNKGRVQIAFVEYKFRQGQNTRAYLDQIRDAVKDIPGAEITVEKEQNGPPVGKPIMIEIAGENFAELISLSRNVERYIDSLQIGGIEDLRSDLEDKNPEIQINIDRVRANREGISTAQIGMEVRTAIFGKEASKFKKDEDEYPIQIRYAEQYRKNIDALLDMKITYRDMNSGLIRQIPLSSVATIEYGNTYGGIRRKDMKRMVSLNSNVLSGYNENEVVQEIEAALARYNTPAGFEVKMGGSKEEQEETANFLMLSLLISFGLIFLILVTQFNSISKPFIILSEILFSIIGVLLGFGIFGFNMSIVMTGVGIVALAGIVVKNGILLVEFSDELYLNQGASLRESVIQAGKARLNPVLLTAFSTTFGLIPMAIGLNINFYTLFAEFDPKFFIGGDSAVFWGPLAWTIIFGLMFATFITLLVLPVMYLINERLRIKILKRTRHSQVHEEDEHELVNA